MRKYSDEYIDQVTNEYIDGQSINRLAVKYKIAYSTIKRWITKRNIPSNNTERSFQKYEIVNDYAIIYIKTGSEFKKALIDIEDVDKCKSFGIWSITKDGYVCNFKTGTYLHRFIMNCDKNFEVDHINHNPLDNRKSKLRIATSSQQKMNTRIRKDNKSGYRGVYYDKERNTWNVHLKRDSKRISKRFNDKSDAILYCKKMKKILQGDFEYKGDFENA